MITETKNTNNIQQVIQKGFKASGDSLSVLVKQKVVTGTVSQSRTNAMAQLFDREMKEDGLYVIKTPLLGNVLTGESLLWIRNAEMDVLSKMASPANMENVAQDCIIKEIDNIISASFISVLSNELNASIYGGVPESEFIDSSPKLSELLDVITESDYFYSTDLLPVNRDFCLFFTWSFSCNDLDKYLKK